MLFFTGSILPFYDSTINTIGWTNGRRWIKNLPFYDSTINTRRRLLILQVFSNLPFYDSTINTMAFVVAGAGFMPYHSMIVQLIPVISKIKKLLFTRLCKDSICFFYSKKLSIYSDKIYPVHRQPVFYPIYKGSTF